MAVVCLDEHVALGMVQDLLGSDLRDAKLGQSGPGGAAKSVSAPGRQWLYRLRVFACFFRLFSRGL